MSFQIVPPEAQWKDCKMKNGVRTNKWTWYEWKKATRASKIKKKCSKEWVAATPDLPYPEVIKKYRQNCKVTHGIEHCFGVPRAPVLPCCKPLLPRCTFSGVWRGGGAMLIDGADERARRFALQECEPSSFSRHQQLLRWARTQACSLGRSQSP